VTIGLNYERSLFGGRGRYRTEVRVGVNRRFRAIYNPLQAAIGQMMAHLPVVETSGENVLGRLRAKLFRSAHFGGYQMAGDRRIKLSAITILQLLAGELDYATFASAHGFDQRLRNPFVRALKEGRVIGHCVVEKSPDEDDDWIAFEFSEPDPAIAPFRSVAEP